MIIIYIYIYDICIYNFQYNITPYIPIILHTIYVYRFV